MIRALPLVLLLMSCTDFPEVGRAEAALGTSAPTPALLTGDQLAALHRVVPDQSSALSGEAAGLRARADRLRRR